MSISPLLIEEKEGSAASVDYVQQTLAVGRKRKRDDTEEEEEEVPDTGDAVDDGNAAAVAVEPEPEPHQNHNSNKNKNLCLKLLLSTMIIITTTAVEAKPSNNKKKEKEKAKEKDTAKRRKEGRHTRNTRKNTANALLRMLKQNGNRYRQMEAYAQIIWEISTMFLCHLHPRHKNRLNAMNVSRLV